MIDLIRKARQVSTPIVAVETPDVAGLARQLQGALNGSVPLVAWDSVRGIMALNDPGQESVNVAAGKMGTDLETMTLQSANPVEALRIAMELAPKTMVLHHNSHLYLEDPFYRQGIANLRDLFKVNQRMLALLGARFALPPELRSDIVVFTDPLPGDGALSVIVNDIATAAGFELGTARQCAEVVDAIRGLPSQAAEQVLAMSATPEGFDLDALWQRKISAVNQTKGLTLSLSRDPVKVGGLDGIMQFSAGIFGGNRPPNVVVWIDEIEKQFGGLGGPSGGGDSSGVTQDSLGTVLRWMDGGGDRQRSTGMLLVGPPGTGKSLLAQGIASKHGIPLFQADLGACKGSLVGESEAAIRDMFGVIDGVAAGNALVVATCNKLDVLPSELRRRFTLGTWFCDLPSYEEHGIIWDIHCDAMGIGEERMSFIGPAENYDGWTGAEIRNCCDIADRLGCDLATAAKTIVPVAQSDPGTIQRLRQAATGRWTSASTGKTYTAKTSEQRNVRALEI